MTNGKSELRKQLLQERMGLSEDSIELIEHIIKEVDFRVVVPPVGGWDPPTLQSSRERQSDMQYAPIARPSEVEITTGIDPLSIEGMELSSSELEELAKASEDDKKNGVDKPQSHAIMNATPAFAKLEATCRLCGQKSMISPALMPPEPARYCCNRCSAEGGRGSR